MTKSVWEQKQALAAPSRYYGHGGTIHGTKYLDVEVHNGEVVAVWFRCQLLPFRESRVDGNRWVEMERTYGVGDPCLLTGVEVRDV